MEDILEGNFENDGDTYFNLSDCHFEFEGHEEIHQALHEIDVYHTNSTCANIDISKYEPCYFFFEHVIIDIFPKNVHSKFGGMKLMIDCLQT